MTLAVLATSSASARIEEFPPSFHTQMVKSGDAEIYVRVGGKGPAVVMLHGFADTGDMWAPLAKAMMADHTIIVPDLRGMGLSSHPPSGYDKLTMPILALGAEKSFGEQQAAILREVGTNVEGGIITGSGHWIMEEQPAQTVKVVKAFLDRK